jgi:hypothetical protein
MAEGLLSREPIAGYGEFRAYLRRERGEMVFEAFREADGRAWLLRLPLGERGAVARLVRAMAPLVAGTGRELPPVEAGGAGVIDQVTIGPSDQLAAVVLEEGEERAFALWRQEQLKGGWSWTIDVVVVPLELAKRLCALVLQVIDRVNAAR